MQLLSYVLCMTEEGVGTFLSPWCAVFLNALCTTINNNHVALLGLVLLKVLFSVTLALLVEQKLLTGWCFNGGRHSWSVWPKAVECQMWNHAKSGMKQWCSEMLKDCQTRLSRSFPFKVNRLTLNWKLPHFLHEYLLWPQMQTSFCFVPIYDHLMWIIWKST